MERNKKRVRTVRKRKARPEMGIIPFSGLRKEMEMTAGELARFLKIIRRIMKEINDTLEGTLDKNHGEEKIKELKYTKVEGGEDIYTWEEKKGG